MLRKQEKAAKSTPKEKKVDQHFSISQGPHRAYCSKQPTRNSLPVLQHSRNTSVGSRMVRKQGKTPKEVPKEKKVDQHFPRNSCIAVPKAPTRNSLPELQNTRNTPEANWMVRRQRKHQKRTP